MSIFSTLAKYGRFVVDGVGRRAPVQLTLFITSRCNIRCKMCFYWEPVEAKSSEEISLDEVRRIAAGMGPLFWLLIGGGEPFVRKDLPDIVKIFYEINGLRHLTIPTNATYPEATEEMVEEILSACPDLFFNLNLSLNGIGAGHDRLCQADGVFDRFLDTYGRLKALKARHPNLGLGINTTHSAYNQETLEPIIDYVVDELDAVDNISLGLVRGRPKESGALAVDMDAYKRAVEKIEGLAVQGRIRAFNALFGGVAFVKDILMRRVIARTVESGWQIPCLAGRVSLVVDEKTNVYPCEMLPAVGNLRDNGFDMRAVLGGAVMGEATARIEDENCFCTHECAYSTNVLFAPRLWPAMAWNLVKLHARRLGGGTRFTPFDDVRIPKPRVSRQYFGQQGELYDGGRTFGQVDEEARAHQPARPF